MFMKKNLLYSFVVLILLFSSCKKDDLNQNDAVISVNVLKVQNKILDNTLNNFGTISYKSKNDVTNLVAGTIVSLNIKEGDYVRKGQVLCRLRNVQLEIEKEQCLSTIESANASLAIQNINVSDQRLSIESRLLSLEKSEMTIKQKELELQSRRKDLENQERLHEIGGTTDVELEKLQISISSLETEISVLKKELEISTLGLRNIDLIQNGITPSSDKEERKKQLIELNIKSAQSQVESAKAQLNSANQKLNSVNKLIEELTIRSPVNGIVGTKYFENGEYVKENEKIITIIDTATVYGVLYVQEQDIVNFSTGALMNITIPSINKTFDSQIDEISPVADPQSGNFSVKTILKNTDGKIKPGMFIKCSILKGEQLNYPCIKDTALINNDEKNAKVFCVVNNLLILKTINIKEHKDGLVWIESGIKEGDIVVNKPSPFLKEGQNVETKK